MSAQVFKVGDVVRLKSGGPKMTVEAGGGDNEWVRVRFFDAANVLHEESFLVSTLISQQSLLEAHIAAARGE
jgi:uncharacterized protein YodC (DUF2158 family)